MTKDKSSELRRRDGDEIGIGQHAKGCYDGNEQFKYMAETWNSPGIRISVDSESQMRQKRRS